MGFALKKSLGMAVLASAVLAEDVLYSERQLQKRYIDADGNWNQSFFHINDVHAHLDEFRSTGTDCTDPTRGCYGGYARISTVVNEIRPTLNSSLFLNAGDEFQGTLFYSYYGGEKIAETLNQLGFDGMTLGNHEFDAGDEVLGQFLENLTFPIICSNIQSDNEVLNRTIQPYHIYDEFQLAVIGVTTPTIPSISSPGPGTTFSAVAAAVQNAIDEIRSTTSITRIAALTHIGYEEDQLLAQSTTGLYLIMGGHSHTPLGTGEDEAGPYPTIVRNAEDEEVFIVTAYRWGEYLGYIDVTYDAEGKILEYHGGPIHMTNATEQDSTLQEQIDAWRVPFEEFAAEVVGSTEVVLDQSTCQEQECTLGDFMADAMLSYRLNSSDTADFALINAGGIRATIDEGDITRGEILTSFPFGNSLVEVAVSGNDLWKVFEGIVTGVSQFNDEEVTSFFQVSRGIKVEYNPENTNGSRLVSVTIGDAPLDREAEYNIVTLDFLAGGGDNFFAKPFENIITLDTQDEILTQYVQAQSPVNIELDGRIAIVNGSAGPVGGNGTEPCPPDTACTPPIYEPPTGNVTTGGGNGSTSSNGTAGGNGTPPPIYGGAAARTPMVGSAVAAGLLIGLFASL